MNGRLYDPPTARSMTPDPNVQSQTQLQSYNRYSYVFNNPLAYTDPTGYLGNFFKNPFKSIVNVVEKIFNTAENIVEAAIHNPVRTIATIAIAYYTGYWIGEGLGAATAATTGTSAFGTYALTAQGAAAFELSTLVG